MKLLNVEFKLKGDVRLIGVSGRIDILALDEKKNQIVIFELKKKQSNHIIVQAIEYSDFIEDNLELIVLKIDNLNSEIKKQIIRTNKKPRLILIANKFLHPSVRKVYSLQNEIQLIQYKYFHPDILELDLLSDKQNLEDLVIYSNSDVDKSISVLKEIVELIKIGLFKFDKDFVIEDGKIFFNGTNCYSIYRDYSLEKNISPISKSDFINNLKNDKNFIKSHRTKRFKYSNSSVYEFIYSLE
ncbi:hypothetical protein [Flavobacterium sp.]|uniref:hypothetical protein n=1 Tax=Flavobacterium sp. TaxID=239 RepID=UPI004048488B